MKLLHFIFLLLLINLLTGRVVAQLSPLSNIRTRQISTFPDNIKLDSFAIVPNSISIKGVSAADYIVNEAKAILTWIRHPLQPVVSITYRVFPFSLNSTLKKFNYDSIRFNFLLEPKQNPLTRTDQSIDFGKFNYTGSIGRGLSVGNSQNAIVNSSMNLQMNGYIGDSLELTAAISDNNIPVQPEGNTQNINDFDKIYMQVKKRNWQVNFGDIDIRQSKNYFLNFYKRLQGASFLTDNKINSHVYNSLLASGAIAKGKFTRNVITPLEGNQGPYKLSSPNGELYFTILASTERVFIDGQIMVRGDDQDYIIDYNTAEITFTPKRLITKDIRIQVEFEYADRNFLNAQLYLNDEIKVNNNLKLSISAFSNSDAKNSPINQQLNPEQKQFLSIIGKNIDSARYPAAFQDTFGVNKILYKKIDTLHNNIHDSIFVYDPYGKFKLYNVPFLYVGTGKGNYMPQDGNANGRVFIWISPDNSGTKKGDWDPVTLLITPKKQQLLSLAAEYKVSKSTNLFTELAMSNYDVNTFSSKDKASDKGYAAKMLISNKSNLFFNKNSKLTLETSLGYEYVQDQFRPIERLRNVEFNRDWGLPFDVQNATENIVNASIEISDQKLNHLKYVLTNYRRSDAYNGIRQSIQDNMEIKGWKISDQIMITNFTYANEKGYYLRPSIDVSRPLSFAKNIVIGGNYIAENNSTRDNRSDSLNPLSFSYSIEQIYLKSQNRSANNWGINYFKRTNKYPGGKYFNDNDNSDNVSLFTQLLANPNQQLRFNATYRNLKVNNNSITNLKPEESFLGRIEYNVRKWTGLLNGNILYEVGNGQEQKRAYTFVEVPAGLGQYTWIDYNNDGIPQLNEFELAVFQDQKKYIKIFTPTNEYIKANYIQFNYSIDLNPSLILQKGNLKNILALLTTNSTLQINRKAIADKAFDLNPFNNKIPDTALIALTSFLSNSVFFNRNSNNWGVDITHRLNDTKSLLTYGFERRKLSDLIIKFRKSLIKSLITSMKYEAINNLLNTPKFTNRNYSIIQNNYQPEIIYTYKTDFRLSFNYLFENKLNRLGTERIKSHAISTDIKYNILSVGSFSSRFTYNNILFNGGDPNSTTGYEMLEGLLPGKNFIWDLELTRKLAGNLELNIQYEGRKPGETPVIHTGRASLRAIF